MTEPVFAPVNLTELMNEGVLMAANERFFWPLGLALTWTVATRPADPPHWCRDERVHGPHTEESAQWHGECNGTLAGEASSLHVREWRFDDGHHESIGDNADTDVSMVRRDRFEAWLRARAATMPIDEGMAALQQVHLNKP